MSGKKNVWIEKGYLCLVSYHPVINFLDAQLLITLPKVYIKVIVCVNVNQTSLFIVFYDLYRHYYSGFKEVYDNYLKLKTKLVLDFRFVSTCGFDVPFSLQTRWEHEVMNKLFLIHAYWVPDSVWKWPIWLINDIDTPNLKT